MTFFGASGGPNRPVFDCFLPQAIPRGCTRINVRKVALCPLWGGALLTSLLFSRRVVQGRGVRRIPTRRASSRRRFARTIAASNATVSRRRATASSITATDSARTSRAVAASSATTRRRDAKLSTASAFEPALACIGADGSVCRVHGEYRDPGSCRCARRMTAASSSTVGRRATPVEGASPGQAIKHEAELSSTPPRR